MDYSADDAEEAVKKEEEEEEEEETGKGEKSKKSKKKAEKNGESSSNSSEVKKEPTESKLHPAVQELVNFQQSRCCQIPWFWFGFGFNTGPCEEECLKVPYNALHIKLYPWLTLTA